MSNKNVLKVIKIAAGRMKLTTFLILSLVMFSLECTSNDGSKKNKLSDETSVVVEISSLREAIKNNKYPLEKHFKEKLLIRLADRQESDRKRRDDDSAKIQGLINSSSYREELITISTRLSSRASASGFIGHFGLISGKDKKESLEFYSEYFTFKFLRLSIKVELSRLHNELDDLYFWDINSIGVVYVLAIIADCPEARELAAKVLNRIPVKNKVENAHDEPFLRFVAMLGAIAYQEFPLPELTPSYKALFSAEEPDTLAAAIDSAMEYHFDSALQVDGFANEHAQVADDYTLSPAFDSDALSLLPIELWAMIKAFPNRPWSKALALTKHPILSEAVKNCLLNERLHYSDNPLVKKLEPYTFNMKYFD